MTEQLTQPPDVGASSLERPAWLCLPSPSVPSAAPSIPHRPSVSGTGVDGPALWNVPAC